MGSQISSNYEVTPDIHDSELVTFYPLYRPFITKFLDSIFFNSETLSQYDPLERHHLILESTNNIYNLFNHSDINNMIQHMNLIIHHFNNIDFRNNLHHINNIQLIDNNQQINDILHDRNNIHRVNGIVQDIPSSNNIDSANDIRNSSDEANDTIQDVSENRRINDIQGANNYIQEVIFIIQNDNLPDIYISRVNNIIESINDIIQDINDTRSNGVPLEIINSLREKTCSADTDDSCAICLKNYKEKETLTILFCNHTFHKECIKRWFENNNNCPICRQKV